MNLVRCFVTAIIIMLLAQPLSANNTAESPLRLVVLGDSLAAGYGLAADDAFPTQLERALRSSGYNVKVINAGVSGDTSAGGLSRLEWTLGDRPHMVIVELGANDALRGLPVEQTFQNLDAILGRLLEEKIKVLLAGMHAPRNLGTEYTGSFDSIYPALADKHKVILYPFFLDGVALRPALNQTDGIHPNPDGVKVIVSRILPYVIDVLFK